MATLVLGATRVFGATLVSGAVESMLHDHDEKAGDGTSISESTVWVASETCATIVTKVFVEMGSIH